MILCRRWIILFGIATLLGTTFPAAAQDQPNVRTIPVDMIGFISALSPDGQTLAVTGHNALYDDAVAPDLIAIRLIDLASGKETARLEGTQTDFATGLAFSANAQTLVSFHNNGQLLVWNVSGRKVVKSYQLPGFGFRLPAFMPDNKSVIAVAPGSVSHVFIIDITTGYITATYGTAFKTYADYRKSASSAPTTGDYIYTALAVAPDAKSFATSTFNDEVGLHDIASGESIVLYQPTDKKMLVNIRPISFTPDSKSLVYYSRDDKKLHKWDIATKNEANISVSGGDYFALSWDGKFVAWIDQSAVYTWDFQAAQATKVADLDSSAKGLPGTTLYLTPDSKQIVVANLVATSGKNMIYVIKLA